MKFWTTLPGLSRWPPASFAVPGANWQEHLAAADFQRIAAAADRLGFDSVSVPEHVVLPRDRLPGTWSTWNGRGGGHAGLPVRGTCLT